MKQKSKRTHGTAQTARRQREKRLKRATTFAGKSLDVPLAATACPTPTKAAFANKPAARRAGRRWAGAGTMGRDEMGRLPKPYKCRCGRYHLGHLPGSVVRGETTRDVLNGHALA